MLQNKEKQIASEEVYRESKKLINSNRYSEALQKFTTILNQKNTPPDTSLYYIWAFLKTKSIPLHAKDKKKVYDMLDAVGLDNQQNALFLFVNGLFMKLTGNIKQARNYLAKANLLDSKMIVARIELSTLKNGKQKSFLAGLFKKGA